MKFVIKDVPALIRFTAKVKNGIWAKLEAVVYLGVRVNFWVGKAPIIAIILFWNWAKVTLLKSGFAVQPRRVKTI